MTNSDGKVANILIYTDGGARGNPGPAGAGAIIYDGDTGDVLAEISEFLGKTTNNVAEYTALLMALQKAKELGGEKVHCRLDSELIVKQMKGEYRVRDPKLQLLFTQIWNLRQQFVQVNFEHVRREKNKEADRLANEAMDRGLSK